jgi:hypothetical protein
MSKFVYQNAEEQRAAAANILTNATPEELATVSLYADRKDTMGHFMGQSREEIMAIELYLLRNRKAWP